MDREEAKEKFREADRLFNERQFAPALQILTELNEVFPNERRVLYPMARCLAGLKRTREALEISGRVAREFGYAPAQELHQRLNKKYLQGAQEPGTTPAPMKASGEVAEVAKTATPPPKNLEERLHTPVGAGAQKTPPPLPAAVPVLSPRRAVIVWIVLILAGYGVFVGVAGTVARPAVAFQMDQQRHAQEYLHGDLKRPEVPWQPMTYFFAAYVFHFYFLSCFPAYWSLRIVNGLRFNEFGEDMKDAATYTLYGFLLAPILIVGWVVFLILFRRHFELSAGPLAGAVALFLVFNGLLWGVDQLLIAFAILPQLGVT